MRKGQQRNPSLEEVIRAAIESYLGDFYVAMPGTVVKYNSATQSADVKPLLKKTVIFDSGEEAVESIPIVPQVPVIFPRTSQYFLSFPLAPGDNVLLLVNDRSIDSYMGSTGKFDVDPVDLRQHDLSDAVCLPGFFPTTASITDVIATNMAMGKEKGAQLRFTGSAVEATTAGAPASIGGFVALATLVLAELVKIQTSIATHIHSGVTTGPGNSGPAVPPTYVPSAVASTNLKAD